MEDALAPAVGATSATNRNRGMGVLAHPAVAACIAIWLVNDHVLKASYGSWWTGKLTDVVALIAFPLLVAAAIERFTRRPLPIALGFTAVFFGAINLWAPADAAVERLMSLVINSRLTMDPTDLVVLPSMIGAWWLWHQSEPQSPEHQRRRLRHKWGRVIFLIGVATTLATSLDEAISQEFEGTIMLTEDQPSVTFPFSLSVDGKPVTDLQDLIPRVTYTSFSMSAPATVGAPAVTIVPTLSTDGAGEITIELAQMELAPVEVEWSVVAITEGSSSLPWSGGDAPEPVLLVTAPPDQVGPEPIHSFNATQASRDEPVNTWEWPVTIEPGADVALSLPSGHSVGLNAFTTDGPFELRPGFLTRVPTPENCDPTSACTFSIWLTTTTTSANFTIAMHGPETTTAAAPIKRKMTLTTRSALTASVVGNVETTIAIPGQLSLPDPMSPLEESTMFFRVYAEVTNRDANVDVERDQLRVTSRVSMGELSLWELQPITECCEPLTVSVQFSAFEDNTYDLVETRADVVVELWTLDPRTRAGIKLIFEE